MDRKSTCLILLITVAKILTMNSFVGGSDALYDIFLLQAALAAKRARELVRTKSVLKSSSLPGKLADCASSDPAESGELLLALGK